MCKYCSDSAVEEVRNVFKSAINHTGVSYESIHDPDLKENDVYVWHGIIGSYRPTLYAGEWSPEKQINICACLPQQLKVFTARSALSVFFKNASTLCPVRASNYQPYDHSPDSLTNQATLPYTSTKRLN